MTPQDIARMTEYFETTHYDAEPEGTTLELDHDPDDGAAAGVLYIAGDNMLLVKRRGGDEAGTWAIPAGRTEEGESPQAAAVREFEEETQHALQSPLLGPYSFLNDDGLRFDAFVTTGPAFTPILDHEHEAYRWVPLSGELPQPLHPGLLKLFAMLEE